MRNYILTLLCFAAIFCHSQNFEKVDSIVKLYPKSFENPEALAALILKDFTTESDKARAVFDWIAYNVTYDVDAYLHPKPQIRRSYSSLKEQEDKEKILENRKILILFNTKRAVCEGYSILFNHISSLVGLKSQIIIGDAKTIPHDIGQTKIIESHAWNAVLIDDSWRLVDVTWGSGSYDSMKQKFNREFEPSYFDMPPVYFFMQHFPINGLWLEKPLDKDKYIDAPLIYHRFIKEKLEIIEPKSGVIKVENNQKIKFKIKNLKNFEGLYYSINKIESTKIEITKTANDIVEFEYVYSNKDGEFITFFVDEKAICAFKLVPKKQ